MRSAREHPLTERVTGIGGVFFRARDPEALVAWYAEHLGVPVNEGYVIFPESRDTHWVPFLQDTDYWPAEKQHMVKWGIRFMGLCSWCCYRGEGRPPMIFRAGVCSRRTAFSTRR